MLFGVVNEWKEKYYELKATLKFLLSLDIEEV